MKKRNKPSIDITRDDIKPTLEGGFLDDLGDADRDKLAVIRQRRQGERDKLPLPVLRVMADLELLSESLKPAQTQRRTPGRKKRDPKVIAFCREQRNLGKGKDEVQRMVAEKFNLHLESRSFERYWK